MPGMLQRTAAKRSGAALLSATRRLTRNSSNKIIWTHTDEAPALASYALLPVIQRFAKPAGIAIETADISVSGRILASFSELLSKEQQHKDELSALGDLAKTPAANIVKLPNVSASIPQLNAAIAELQSQGFAVPDFPTNPKTDAEKDAAARYAKVLGSAVNPVLREGNSDRRVAGPVKSFAMKNPHKMGKWETGSTTTVAHMTDGDFYSSEQSATMEKATDVRIEHVGADGTVTVLKPSVPLQAGEVIDSSRMSISKLNDFYETTLAQDSDASLFSLSLLLPPRPAAPSLLTLAPLLTSRLTSPAPPPPPPSSGTPVAKVAKVAHSRLTPRVPSSPPAQAASKDHMVSLHLKATMMKISDPILFGHAVKVYFKDAFAKHADTLAKVGANPNDGLGQVLDSLKGHPAVLADFAKCYESRPPLAMVDSAKGITNLHVPSDVIIDASMPCVVRDSGKMWNKCAAAPRSLARSRHPRPAGLLPPSPSGCHSRAAGCSAHPLPPPPHAVPHPQQTGTTRSRTSSASSRTAATRPCTRRSSRTASSTASST